MLKPRVRSALGVVSMLGLVAVGLPAQGVSSVQPPPGSTLDALLAEVRGLRAEINQASSASIRTQLLTARLQLQEQRVYTAARQLTEVQGLLATIRQEIAQQSTRIKQWEEAESRVTDEGELRALRQAIPQNKAELEPKQRREQELRTQETELFNALDAEQARWTEFNGRLDEIERSLAATPR